MLQLMSSLRNVVACHKYLQCISIGEKKREAEDHSRIHELNIVAHSSVPWGLRLFSSANGLMHNLFFFNIS